MKTILVSACLLGAACRYDGKSKPSPEIIALRDKYNIIPVCPEIYGGLPTPRVPCEIKDGGVFSLTGENRTAEYLRGAGETLRLAEIFGCDTAVLKERSPACGCGEIYDGSFSGTLVKGDVVCAALLKKNGVRVLGESRIKEI